MYNYISVIIETQRSTNQDIDEILIDLGDNFKHNKYTSHLNWSEGLLEEGVAKISYIKNQVPIDIIYYPDKKSIVQYDSISIEFIICFSADDMTNEEVSHFKNDIANEMYATLSSWPETERTGLSDWIEAEESIPTRKWAEQKEQGIPPKTLSVFLKLSNLIFGYVFCLAVLFLLSPVVTWHNFIYDAVQLWENEVIPITKPFISYIDFLPFISTLNPFTQTYILAGIFLIFPLTTGNYLAGNKVSVIFSITMSCIVVFVWPIIIIINFYNLLFSKSITSEQKQIFLPMFLFGTFWVIAALIINMFLRMLS